MDHTIQDHNPEAENFDDPAEHPALVDLNGDREPPELSAGRRSGETRGNESEYASVVPALSRPGVIVQVRLQNTS